MTKRDEPLRPVVHPDTSSDARAVIQRNPDRLKFTTDAPAEPDLRSPRDWLKGRPSVGQVLRDHHGRYITPREMVDEARPLLARTQAARDAIESAAVTEADLIDRQHVAVALPAFEWDIAVALAEYSRLVREQRLMPASLGDTAAQVRELSAQQLRETLAGIKRRVEALEDVAAATAEAEARYEELRQLDDLEAHGGKILDLVARSTGDAYALEEIRELSSRAAVVATALRTSVKAARDAGRGAAATNTQTGQ